MRPPRGRRPARAAGPLRSFQYHFSDLELREAIEIVNRGDCLYSDWRPTVVEESEDRETKKENRWKRRQS